MYLDINGQKIYYQRVGRGKNLVLLHGWGQDVSTFWPLIDLLNDTFTLWLIDLPGFGRSDLPKKDWHVLNYAELIHLFIQKKKISNPIIIGHSLGGRVAIKLAAKYPRSLRKLILESSAGIKQKQGFIRIIVYIMAKLIKFVVPNFFNLKQIMRHRLYQLIGSDYESTGSLKNTFLNIINEDLSKDLNRISHETLLIWGENDKTVPLTQGKKMYQLIKNSRLEVLEDVGHFPHLENPKLFTYYVKDFS